MQQDRKCHVLLLYSQMIPSIRLCGHCQMEYLAGEGKLEYRAIQEAKLHARDLNWADIVLIGRMDNWYEAQIVKMISKSGRNLIYVIDDDLLNVPPEISSAAHYQQAEVQQRILTMMGMCDAILSPSPPLLEKYASGKQRAIQIEEPALWAVPYRPHDLNRPVKIGFAGSIDRTGDLECMLKDVLVRIKHEYGDRVQFEFFGAIPSFAQDVNAKTIPYQNSYQAYRQTLNDLDWDIGLAPMPDTPFHACKHYNKMIEYSATGTMGIFSDTEPYTRLKAMDVPAVFCSNDADAWYDALTFYISHHEDREALRRRSADAAKQRFSVEQSAQDLMNSVKELLVPRPDRKNVAGNLRITKIRYCGHTMLEKWNRYGWRIPLVAAHKLASKLLHHRPAT